MKDLLIPRQNHYSLMGSQNLSVSRVHTTAYGLRSVRCEGPRLWNRLPENLMISDPIHDFRSMINAWNEPTYGCKVCKHFSV